MKENLPVTVVLPSYNHSKYIGEALDSVLAQTCSADEIIVVDDGSSDESVEILRAYGRRITLIEFEENRGAAVATNTAIREAKNPYIALINSDDNWNSRKLELQFSWMTRNNFDLTFTTASIVDGNSMPLANPPAFFDVFLRTQPINQSFLYHFFYHGNFLCHPSLIIKRDQYLKYGFYSNKYRQLPDFERWITFSKRSKIGIMDNNLVNFRWTEGLNTSSQDLTSSYIRTQNECLSLYLNFFNGLEVAEIQHLFSKELDLLDSNYRGLAASDPASALLLTHPEPSVRYQTMLAGYLRLMQGESLPEVDKLIQDLSGSFQVSIEFEKLHNYFHNKSKKQASFEHFPPNVRKFIRKLKR